MFGIKRRVPRQRTPLDDITDPVQQALNALRDTDDKDHKTHPSVVIRAARRQAFRFGEQISGLTVGTSEYVDVMRAWNHFILQFRANDDVMFDYLKRAFDEGLKSTSTRSLV